MSKLKKMGVKQFDGSILYLCTHKKCEHQHVILNDDELKKAGIEQPTKPWWKCTNPICPYNEPYQEPFDKD